MFEMPEALGKILDTSRSRWLVTGAAGFIGSNLCLALVRAGHTVRALDNFATGSRLNIAEIEATALQLGGKFEFIEGNICNVATCEAACENIDYVLHQAALGSVPRSILTPLVSHETNVDGFLNMLQAATKAKVRKFVYASSSSVYGDSPLLPKREALVGEPLSPYAANKAINEMYARVFQRCYGLSSVGLRYFNVFGPRQDPNGPYAAVIPKWISAAMTGESMIINGDGSTSRDFCFIENVLQANFRSALHVSDEAQALVFNVACGERTSLNELATAIKLQISLQQGRNASQGESELVYRDFRAGDIPHSLADISHIKATVGYEPSHRFAEGLAKAVEWYLKHPERLASSAPAQV